MTDGSQGGAPRGAPGGPAFEALRRKLLLALRRQCPASLRPSLEDLVQTALLRSMEAVARSGEGIDQVPASYLHKAAYCALVDEWRRQRARPEAPWEGDLAESVAHSAPRPDQVHESRRIGAAIRECLAGLALARRRAVTLVLQGHTVPETATLLLWSFKRTENLVYRGLADLRACLRGKGIER